MRTVEIIPYTPEYRSLEKDRGRSRLFGILFFWLDPKEPKGQGCGEQFTALPRLTQSRPSDLRRRRNFLVSLGSVGGSREFLSKAGRFFVIERTGLGIGECVLSNVKRRAGSEGARS